MKNKIKMKKILITTFISAIIILILIFFKHYEDPQGKKKLIETNFVQLEIDKHHLFSETFFIAYNKKNSKIYAINRNHGDIYLVSMDDNYENPIKEKFISLPKNGSIANIFVLDISYDDNKIYVSAVNEKSINRECYYLTLFEYDLNTKVWNEIFKSTPCIAKIGFHDIGGRITHNSKNIFLSGGNIFSNELNPYNYGLKNINQTYKDLISSTNIFGSIVQINKKTKSHKKISYGHRTPGGLFWDHSRNILWETEHGPRGGDELNIIKKNQNYGWPNVTLGKTYIRKTPSEYNTQYNSHQDFDQPYFSWTPSIGISQLGVVSSNGNFSQYWNGNDLIISSLKDKSLYRNRIEKDKVIYSERIYINERIRSLVVSENVIISSTDDGKLLIIKPSEKPLTDGPFPSLK